MPYEPPGPFYLRTLPLTNTAELDRARAQVADSEHMFFYDVTEKNHRPVRCKWPRGGRRVDAMMRTDYRREDLVSAAEDVLDDYVLEGLDEFEAAAYLSSE